MTVRSILATAAFSTLLMAAGSAGAATVVTYTATGGPGGAPDGVDQNNTPVDVWTETVVANSGGAGSYSTGNGWALYSYPDAGAGAVNEVHAFDGGPLLVGQTVSLTVNNSAVFAGRRVGFSLTGGTAPISFAFIGGVDDYRYSDSTSTDADTGFGFLYQQNIPVTLTLNSLTTYTGTAGSGAGAVSWTGTYAGAITGIDVYNSAAGNGSDFTFNNLAVSAVNVPEPATLGAIVGLLAPLARRRRA